MMHIPPTTGAPATTLHTLALDDLPDWVQRGRRIRASCPIHGGDHQRSLSIETDGDALGYGYCHSCRARVFVPELNPDEAVRRADGQERAARAPSAADLLRPPRRARPAPTAATPADWQREEVAALVGLDERMHARLTDARPLAYLAERGVPLEFAQTLGVGYIPADARLTGQLAKWRDRIMFPLGSPDGRGYAGRALALWKPGMDETAHKALLESTPGAPRRWEKTYPAGWFNYDVLAIARYVVMVEGPFDLLALVASVSDQQLIATVGTAARMEWLPRNVWGVVLAYDADAGGQHAAAALARDAASAGLRVITAAPSLADGYGKDWSERWRRAQWDGVAGPADALLDLELLDAPSLPLVLPPSPSVVHAAPVTPVTLVAPVSPIDALWAEALADPVVKTLLTHGFTVAEVRPLATGELAGSPVW